MKPYSKWDRRIGNVLCVVTLLALGSLALGFEKHLADPISLGGMVLLAAVIVRRAWSRRNGWY